MSRSTRHPSTATVLSIVALVLAASGTAMAASTLVGGDTLIKKHSLSGNRLRNHTIAGAQLNFKQLGAVPSVTGFYNSGLVKLTSTRALPGTRKTLITRGPFTFIAQCVTAGTAFITASVIVRDNSAHGAVEEDDTSGSSTTLNPGDMHTVFSTTGVVPAWQGDHRDTFSVAGPGGPALSGLGGVGVSVLGSDCAFQLVLFG